MMNKFKKLLMEKAKKGKVLSDDEISNKSAVLDEIDSIMGGAMGDKLKGMKKVTVASPTDKGLEEGLVKAKEVLEEKEGDSDEDEELSAEEIKAKIAELQAKLD